MAVRTIRRGREGKGREGKGKGLCLIVHRGRTDAPRQAVLTGQQEGGGRVVLYGGHTPLRSVVRINKCETTRLFFAFLFLFYFYSVPPDVSGSDVLVRSRSASFQHGMPRARPVFNQGLGIGRSGRAASLDGGAPSLQRPQDMSTCWPCEPSATSIVMRSGFFRESKSYLSCHAWDII
jgi:hypothetical protein